MSALANADLSVMMLKTRNLIPTRKKGQFNQCVCINYRPLIPDITFFYYFQYSSIRISIVTFCYKSLSKHSHFTYNIVLLMLVLIPISCLAFTIYI